MVLRDRVESASLRGQPPEAAAGWPVPSNFVTSEGGASRNATATARRAGLITAAMRFSSSPRVCTRTHGSFSLNNLGFRRIAHCCFLSRRTSVCAEPHGISLFCTCSKQNRVFPLLFAVCPLRSRSAFAIVRCGPVFCSKNSVFLCSRLTSIGFEVDRILRRISRLNGSQALEQTKNRGAIAEKVGTSKKTVVTFFDELHKLAVKEAKGSAGKFVIPVIGRSREGASQGAHRPHPYTGEQIKIKAKTVVRLRRPRS